MAKEKYEGKLEQGKGTFKLRGIIQGKDKSKNNFGFQDVAAKDNKKAYRKLKFYIQTANDNKPIVEIFGCPQQYAYAYSKTTKKTQKLDWAKRFNPLPEGFNLIKPPYDLAKEFNSDFHDGDSVVVIGEPTYSVYDNPNSGIKEKKFALEIKSIYPATEPIDFDKENFEEEATFAQDISIVDSEEVKEDKKVYIYAYVIGYKGKFTPATFEINTETANAKFVRNMKSLKFGDSIRINGVVSNRVVTEEVPAEDDGWGTKEKVATKFHTALEITGADGTNLEKKKYKEEDFVETQEEKADKIFKGDLSGVEKNNIESSKDDSSSDELPFEI